MTDPVDGQERRRSQARDELDEITQRAVADGMYNLSVEDYRDVLRDVRHVRAQRRTEERRTG